MFLSSRRVPIDVILFLKGMLALMVRHVTVNLSQSHRKQARYLRTKGAQSVPGLPAGLGCASLERSIWGAATASDNKNAYVTSFPWSPRISLVFALILECGLPPHALDIAHSDLGVWWNLGVPLGTHE